MSEVPEAVSVSKADGSSDREQSDADHLASAEKLDELVETIRGAEGEVPEALAVSAEDGSSDRGQSDADQVVTVDKLDDLADATANLAESQRTLALAMVEYQERAKTAQRRFLVTVVLLMLAMALVVLQNIEARQSRRQIADCIEPSGACYKSSQERTDRLVSQLNESNAAASAAAVSCAQSNTGYVAVKACVDRTLR